MADISFEEIAQLAEQLKPEEQAALVARLQLKIRKSPPMTREQILAEFERRKTSGAFKNAEILRNKYANSAFNISDDQLLNDIHEAATEWEKELDEFFPED